MNQDICKNSLEEISFDKIGEIIKLGDIVEIKSNKDDEWISSIVKDELYNYTLSVLLVDEFIKQDKMVGDSIECRIIKNNVVYLLNAKINDIGMIHYQKVIIQILKANKYYNERENKRYTVNFCGRIIYENSEKSTFIIVKNISNTGISIICREQLPLGEEVDIDIVLWKQEVLAIEGKIVRMYKVDKNYKYGVVIEGIDNKSKKLLEDFIKEMEKKEEELKKR